MGIAGLTIDKGQRHCRVLDQNGKTVFKATSVKDAEHYVELRDELLNLRMLLESRGIAPHRIYLLAHDEEKRGRVYLDNAPASEVVITAKSGDGVVIKHLHDGREEIVDLDELEAIHGGAYLRASEIHDEAVHVVVRFDREEDSYISVGVFREKDNADDLLEVWQRAADLPGPEYTVTLAQADGEGQYYRGELSIED